MTLYIVVNPDNHDKTPGHPYVTHPNLASAAAEAIRLSKKHPERTFLVLEARDIGKVVDGRMKESDE